MAGVDSGGGGSLACMFYILGTGVPTSCRLWVSAKVSAGTMSALWISGDFIKTKGATASGQARA